MAQSIDTRNFDINRATQARIDELSQAASFVSTQLPANHAVDVSSINSLTGTPNTLVSNNAPSVEGALIDHALNFVSQASPAFGFSPGEPVEFVPDPNIQSTRAGSQVVHLQQSYRGIPVFQMVRTVRFSSNREITDVVGNNVDLPPGINIAPQIDVTRAVTAAAEYVASDDSEETTDGWGQQMTSESVDLSGYVPRVLIGFPLPNQPTVLEKGPFADLISAHLVLFYQNPQTRLGWYIRITLPDYRNQYELIVSADQAEPEILYCQCLMQTALAQGNVYTENPETTPLKTINFPRDLSDYPVPRSSSLPLVFPGHWCSDDKCIGNSTIATLGFSTRTFQGQILQGGNVDFNATSEDDQKVLNIFYFCNYMHNFFYLLGFDEEAGNFQEVNFTGQATAGDPVEAHAHSGAVRGTANMLTLADGRRPVMNMGLVSSSGRHTAFDADVVFHEFTHGVSNRLVGGRMNSPMGLQQPQSRGMGEGWSDYFALTIRNFGKTVEKVVTGDWVTGDPRGIRGFPYDSNFPHGFDMLGKDRYVGVAPNGQPWPHPIGEIWCATLMQMNRNIGAALGSADRGHQIGWQIVVDGMKLSPANPSFLDARDAILKALDDLHTAGRVNDTDYTNVKKAVWTAFAKFGMGSAADCIGASVSGIVADFNMPSGLQ
ncbi:MAG: hypothetical protein HC866_23020 [Leptolyngbyaceae cyanobacterium RU_5_1]|nr:hypothetical protein [Leptolyngbyaceae cyanobacterium RU_5_1]